MVKHRWRVIHPHRIVLLVNSTMKPQKWKVCIRRSDVLCHTSVCLASNSSHSTVQSHSHSCHCDCHQSMRTMTSTDEYLLFEQALQQTRQEQEQEQQQHAFATNRLLQTLKQQHEELMTFYQQQVQTKRIDREQQTVSVGHQDFQIQTDLINQPPTFKPAPSV